MRRLMLFIFYICRYGLSALFLYMIFTDLNLESATPPSPTPTPNPPPPALPLFCVSWCRIFWSHVIRISILFLKLMCYDRYLTALIENLSAVSWNLPCIRNSLLVSDIWYISDIRSRSRRLWLSKRQLSRRTICHLSFFLNKAKPPIQPHICRILT